ncbi:protein kinase [Cellulosimicrobium sp. KWT-B]|uniref:protein kinase domain-containing protein n=1 Tax=Cellulosimicrobium sp. KWT-B TaxID=1981152 RepID=UPI000A32A7EF|nr:protein kinase [Cellulosimicrobium sp. KWT-B]
MAELKVMGEYVGPGEQKTAERLAEELPADWVVYAGRKLAGDARDDVDLIVVGKSLIFVLDEKSWGPRIVADDNWWLVNDEARPNPLNRVGQLARKIAGLLRDKAKGYRELRGKRVLPAVVLSNERARVTGGRNHDYDERIWMLEVAAKEMRNLDRREPPLGDVHRTVRAYLDGLQPADKRDRIGDYAIISRLDVPGVEQAYLARGVDGQEVVLKGYPIRRLEELGDPKEFLRRETVALNRLADLGRTWHARPFFESAAHELFVVPVVPPKEGGTLEDAIRRPGPERTGGKLEDQVARDVVRDAFMALADVHEQGLVHRALHPRRIWLGRRMRVMFSDFHLARISGEMTVARWAPDYDISEDYRAPESAADVGSATPKSDVYSLTLSLCTWLLGKPATEISLADVSSEVLAAFPWTEQLVRGLSQKPANRPDANELAEALAPGPTAVPVVEDEPVAEDFSVGGVVAGRYEIKAELGRGGYARSWKVYDRQAEHTKVLKQFFHGIPGELRKEYRAADALRHENCGRVYDVAVDREPHFLVSEYVEGESLAVVGIDREVEEVRTIAVRVLEALEYIHSKHLVHGDVTPANIIVSTDGSGEAKLIDFGLSVAAGDPAEGWSPKFAAPEVAGRRPSTPASDLFSFAASMAFAMLGRVAVRVEPGSVTLLPPTENEISGWGESGRRLLDAFLAALTEDENGRPPSARDFKTLVQSTQATPAPGTPSTDGTDNDDEPPALARLVNPAVPLIRRLYRAASGGNAGNRGLDDDFAKTTYVETLLDSELIPRVLDREFEVVLLSGNPGDGKTSVLVKLGEGLRGRGAEEIYADAAGWCLRLDGHSFIAVYDASESHGDLTSDELVRRALDPVQTEGSGTALIAVNDGRMLQFFTDYSDKYEEWAFAIEDQSDDTSVPGALALVDLKRRSLARMGSSPGLAGRALDELTDEALWDTCKGCLAQSSCPLLANRNLLASAGAKTFDELIQISHLRRRRRATFRDVRSAAAWLITGNRSCEDVHEWEQQGRSALYMDEALTHDLAFSRKTDDYLVSEWADVDPSAVAAPAVDRLRRELLRNPATRHLNSVSSIARAVYFGVGAVKDDEIDPGDVRVYRYLPDFLEMLMGHGPETTRDRLLLGISRITGAFGYLDSGLAMSSGADGAAWAILHTVAAEEFTVTVPRTQSPFIESMPDQLLLSHQSGPRLSLTLDTAEIILRAADGELVGDTASDAIRQEIDSFVNQLSRQPSRTARVVDSSGSVVSARVHGDLIELESAR